MAEVSGFPTAEFGPAVAIVGHAHTIPCGERSNSVG